MNSVCWVEAKLRNQLEFLEELASGLGRHGAPCTVVIIVDLASRVDCNVDILLGGLLDRADDLAGAKHGISEPCLTDKVARAETVRVSATTARGSGDA